MIPMIHFLSHDMGRWEINPPSRKGNKNSQYSRTYNNNNIFTFDTETTSIVMGDNKYSFVYIAMLSINGVVYSMRNLNVFKQFLDMYNPIDNTVNVIYVHNLGFDFTFLQNVLEFDSVFARNAHRPIFARYKNWEFRCSYFLSQMSLKNVGESYDLPHAKQVDALNYKKRRHTGTPLTDAEDIYCEYDCLVLHDFVQYELNRNGGKYRDIPYTQTGYVRRYILDAAKQDKQYWALRDLVQRTRPDIQLFQVLEKCYTGGYTHANFMAVASGVYTHVKSYDFTSSYPAVMCRCKFPMGKFRAIACNFDYYLTRPDEYCTVGKIRMTNVTAKSKLCYISQHKIIRGSLKNGVFSNGRLYKCDELEMYVTNVDILTIKMMYKCDIDIVEMWACRADYLPKTVVKSILTLYGNKTKYKNVPDKSVLYMASKQMVNSVYGMSVFNPFCDDIEYDAGEWETIAATPEKLTKYYQNPKTILPYQWGVFVTAWARNKLCNIASQIGDDVLYMDTDSIKFIGDYDDLFVKNNAEIHAENVTSAAHFGFDISDFAPCDVKNKPHELGLWDFEHEYKSFRVLGAKRYCYTLQGDPTIYPVVAGCPTQKLREYLMTHGCNALLRPFTSGLFLDEHDSGKNAIYYSPENYDVDIPVTDYTGDTKMEHIGWCATVVPTTFDMSMSDDYLQFLMGYAVTDKRAIIRDGLFAE